MRKRYILIKETPELKVGALLEEMCDAGNQAFHTLDKSFSKHDDQSVTVYTRKTVMEQPEWFEEIKPVWLRIADLSILKELIKERAITDGNASAS